MDIVRAHVERVEIVGLDEAYLDVAGLYSPRAAMRRLLAEIKSETQLTCSIGLGPNKLVAKVASDAEKPAGFVVLTREQACARFASSPPSLVPGIGPKTAARLAEMGLSTLAALAAAPEQLLVERFGPNLGRELRTPRALRTQRRDRRRAQGRLRVARAYLRHPMPATTQMREHLSLMAEELCAGLAATGARPHDRRSRSASTSTTVTRAHSVAEATCDVQLVSEVALRLLREYAAHGLCGCLGLLRAACRRRRGERPARQTPDLKRVGERAARAAGESQWISFALPDRIE